MDEKDRLLLTYLQNGLPWVPSPFNGLAAKTGTDVADLLMRIHRLQKEGTLKETRAVFDPRSFHYQCAWVAWSVPSEEIETCARLLGQHPGVLYICEHGHEFNLWFFIAVPPGPDPEVHARHLAKLAGAGPALFLPIRKVLKGTDLAGVLDAGAFLAMNDGGERRHPDRSQALTAEEISMVRELQRPFPLTDEPYRRIAEELGVTEDETFDRIKTLAGKGCLKKIAGVLSLAIPAPRLKTLVAWRIPEEKEERIGAEIAAFPEVIYADVKPAYPGLPYSFYTVIRTGTADELGGVISRLRERIGPWPHQALPAVREFKKEGIRYFPKELDVWWRQHAVTETAFH